MAVRIQGEVRQEKRLDMRVWHKCVFAPSDNVSPWLNTLSICRSLPAVLLAYLRYVAIRIHHRRWPSLLGRIQICGAWGYSLGQLDGALLAFPCNADAKVDLAKPHFCKWGPLRTSERSSLHHSYALWFKLAVHMLRRSLFCIHACRLG